MEIQGSVTFRNGRELIIQQGFAPSGNGEHFFHKMLIFIDFMCESTLVDCSLSVTPGNSCVLRLENLFGSLPADKNSLGSWQGKESSSLHSLPLLSPLSSPLFTEFCWDGEAGCFCRPASGWREGCGDLRPGLVAHNHDFMPVGRNSKCSSVYIVNVRPGLRKTKTGPREVVQWVRGPLFHSQHPDGSSLLPAIPVPRGNLF